MSTSSARNPWLLPAVITVLAIADGILHIALDAILFRGNFFGRLGPPPGAPASPSSGPPPGPPIPLPLPVNQMFVLNLVGYVILVALLWYAVRRATSWRPWVDVVFVVYVLVTIGAWLEFGAPNPMGYLGYLSKAVEVILLLALLTDLWGLFRRPVATLASASRR